MTIDLRAARIHAGAVLALCLLAPAAALAQAAPPADAALPGALSDFDAYVEGVRETFEVPGIAVAVVKNGEVVLARGYGVRELGRDAPVEPETLFAIASISKGFTAPYVTYEMRIRDLLAHRSGLGLGAGDLLYWPGTDYTTREVAQRLKDVPLDGAFRGKYAYDNILYGVAQLVVEEVSGVPFETFLRARIFGPLGMDAVRFNSDALRRGDNVATGHSRADFKDLVPAPRLSWANVSGAGGLYANVLDMSKWMRVHLAGGAIEGEGEAAKRLVSKERQDAMWSVVTPIPVSKPSVPELEAARPNFLGYGEGWQLSDYRGEKLVWHTGGWPGMVSRMTLVPEEGLGVIVLTNAELGGAFNAVTLRVLDAYLDAPQTDWTAAYAAALAKSQSDSDEDWEKHVAARDASSTPSLPLTDYAGTYRDPWYGDVVVAMEDGTPRLRFARTQQLVGTLQHWQHDTFIVRWDRRWLNADAFVNFALDPDGEVREVRMEAVSPLTDFSFDFHHLRLAPVLAPVVVESDAG